jgi:hypothetical protein
VVDDLAAVSHTWLLDSDGDRKTDAPIDVLTVLKITTRAIRSIRNYLLSLPDESTGTIRAHFRPKILGPGKAQPHSNVPASSSSQPDPLTLIRRSALEVLTVLRALEETCRLPLSDDAYDAQSDGGGGSHSRLASPINRLEDLPPDTEGGIDPDTSVTFSLVQVQGRYESVPVWEDEDDGSFPVGIAEEEEKEKREHWDERLVLGSGWLYRQDVTLDELAKERDVVSAYVDVVDEVLFGGKKTEGGKERGWERERRKVVEKEDRGLSRAKGRRVSAIDSSGRGSPMFLSVGDGGRRRVSTGMLDMMGGVSLSEEPDDMGDIREDDEAEESVDDEELPEWAHRNSFVNDNLSKCIFTFSSTPYLHFIRSCTRNPVNISAIQSTSSTGTAHFANGLSVQPLVRAVAMHSVQLLCAKVQATVGVRQQRRNPRHNRPRKSRTRGERGRKGRRDQERVDFQAN